jgi:hypothetical protein
MRGLLLAVLLLLPAACDLALTYDPVPYAQLDAAERAASDRIFARLQAWDARLRVSAARGYTLGAVVVDQNLIDVSVHELWVMTNLGDDRLHLSVWENLTAAQRALFASWFGESLDAAAVRFGNLFYEFVALHLAGVQTVYAVQGVDWVYAHRHMFNLDRDAQRLVVTYLKETEPSLFDYVWAACGAIRGMLDARFQPLFSMEEYGAHVRELTDPADPSGQIYMICRHMEQAEIRRQTWTSTFAAEIAVLEAYLTDDGASSGGAL